MAVAFGAKLRVVVGADRPIPDLEKFWREPSEAESENTAQGGPLSSLFFGNKDRIVDKWLQYFPVYERYLSAYRGQSFKMLEIGVFKGGSLKMWRDYFGQDAVLWGIDIDPACADFVSQPNQVRIGSQDDAAFLRRVVDEMGGIDVVLDDGSHIAHHQRTSFDTLFPLLSDGGLYIIEDTHTSYWAHPWGGGFGRKGTAIEFAKSMIDHMHHWYHGRSSRIPGSDGILAVHFHDSMIIIEKGAPVRPIRTQVGKGRAPR
jgi:hypothetical protein